VSAAHFDSTNGGLEWKEGLEVKTKQNKTKQHIRRHTSLSVRYLVGTYWHVNTGLYFCN
jgi:hypothetical protein